MHRRSFELTRATCRTAKICGTHFAARLTTSRRSWYAADMSDMRALISRCRARPLRFLLAQRPRGARPRSHIERPAGSSAGGYAGAEYPPDFGPRPGADSVIEVREALEDLDGARPNDDHEKGGEHAQDQREHDLHGCLGGLRFDRLPPLDPQLRRLRSKHARDRDTEDISLHHREREGVQLLDVRALGEVAEGVRARDAELD